MYSCPDSDNRSSYSKSTSPYVKRNTSSYNFHRFIFIFPICVSFMIFINIGTETATSLTMSFPIYH